MVVTQPVLPMEGSLPPDLQGTLFRVGPRSPGRTGREQPQPVSDDNGEEGAGGSGPGENALGRPPGALHAVELRDGAAVSYLSRESDADAGVFWHAGSVLALPETGLPLRYSRVLQEQGFAGSLKVPLASHTHRVASDGGRILFSIEDRSDTHAGTGEDGDADGSDAETLDQGIWLLIGEWDAAGALRTAQAVSLERATWQHDVAVTDRHVVFVESPTRYVPGLAAAVPFGWVPGAEGWVGVVDRGGDGAVRWFRHDPALVTHVLGAWEEPAPGAAGEADTDIVLYVCRYDVPEEGQPVDLGASVVGPQGIGLTPIGDSLAVLERWRLQGDRLERTQVDERNVEYPRMDAVCTGGPFRFGYCVETSWAGSGATPGSNSSLGHPGLLQFDLQRDEVASWTPGPGRTPSEPIFVRARDGHGDDEGWLLSVVDDPDRGASDLYVLDASSFGRRQPEAVIHLPARLPFRSHGEWVPADAYR
jgi:carotenoid cleavage dioxygenase-like enzyme